MLSVCINSIFSFELLSRAVFEASYHLWWQYVCSFITFFYLFSLFLATLSVQDIYQGPLLAIYTGLLLKPLWALKMWSLEKKRIIGFLGLEWDHEGQHLSSLFTVRFLRHLTKIIAPELENEAGLKIKNQATVETEFALRPVFPTLGFCCLELLTESDNLANRQ